MPNNTYQSEFTGPQMDSRLGAVATLQEAVAALETAVAAKYAKPAGGIPSSDMDADVQNALAKALTAVQSLADYYTKSETDALLAAIAASVNATAGVTAASLPTASASTVGKMYYIGPDGNGEYARYVTSYDGTTYSWLSVGTTDIDLTQYATQAELSQLDQKLYGKRAYTFNADSAEHGSMKDLYSVFIPAGGTLKGKVTAGTGVCDGTQMRAYVFNSAQTAVTFVPIVLGEPFTITPASDVYYIGIYLYKVTTLGTFNLEFETPSIVGKIEDDLADLTEVVDDIVSFQDSTGLADTVGHWSNAANSWIIINKPSVAGHSGYLRKVKAYVPTGTSFYVCVGDFDPLTLEFVVRRQQLVTFTGDAGAKEAAVDIYVEAGQYVGVHGDGSHTLPGYGSAVSGSGGWYWKSSGGDALVEGSSITLSDLSNYSLAFGWQLEFSKFVYKESVPAVVEITATRNEADFNSIREIIAAITDASPTKQYIIVVPNGRWFECDLNGKPFVTVRGESMEGTVLYCDGTSSKLTPADYSRSSYRGVALSSVPQDQKHCIFALKDMVFENLTIEVNDAKYCAHLDQAGWNSARFNKVHFLAKANTNYPIGMGLRGGQDAAFIDCVIETRTGGLGFVAHNWNNQSKASALAFSHCYFKGCGFGVLNELGSDQNDAWEMNDCFSDMDGEVNFMVDTYNGATYWTNPDTGEKETDPTAVPYCISLNAVGSNVSLVSRALYSSVIARPNADRYIQGAKFICTASTGRSVGEVIKGYVNGRTLIINSTMPIVGVVDSIVDGVAYIATDMVMLANAAIGGTPAAGAPVYDSNGSLTTVASGNAVGAIVSDRFSGYKIVKLFN